MPRETNETGQIDEERSFRGADAALADLATRQNGVVAGWQLSRLGMSTHAVAARVRKGQLLPLHRGVFAVGHAGLSASARWLAGALAIGPDAVVSHRCGADLWGLAPTSRAGADVTVPRQVRSRQGITVHRAPLDPTEVTHLDEIPVTTPSRTLLDLATVVDGRRLERALERAEALRLFNRAAIDATLERHAGRRGAGRLRVALGEMIPGGDAAASELERRFLSFVRDAGLPLPIVNRSRSLRTRDVEPDICWPAHRLIVELDSRLHHHTTAAFERDRARDRVAVAAGWRVVRITWRQLHREPHAVAADLRAALGSPRP